MSPSEKLARGIAELDLVIPAETQSRLLDYVALISKWNRVHHLTAVRGSLQMVSSHLLDCLAIMPYVEGKTALDVGSGAGLPGIPIALMRPQTEVTLLDSNHKKTAFLRQVIIELGLKNTVVITERVETWRAPQPYDLVISRALCDLAEFLQLAGRQCAPSGTVAAMKGVYPHAELAELPEDFKLDRVIALRVPGLRAERHLVLLKPGR